MNTPMTMVADEFPDASDAELAGRSAAGDQHAFDQIVRRYQTLVCSLAYNATGDVARSEDLAQETFVTAWQHRRELREPAKMRAWLCGIARNLINNRHRQLQREPVHGAGELDLAAGVPAVEPWPSDAAIARERQAMLWQALERVPGTYREPLILFYREHRSITRVARDLELSEDAVKQRLARGRKLLHAQVIAFVEGALAQTAPGPAFTLGVIGALPLYTATSLATVGSVGGTAAKTGLAALGAKSLLAFNFVAGPFLALLAAWFNVRASLADTRNPRERALVKRYFLMVAAGTVLFTIASIPLNALAKANGDLNPAVMAVWLALLVANVGGVAILARRLQRTLQRLRPEEGERNPGPSVGTPTGAACLTVEYRSRWTLLGLPLIHVRLTPKWDDTHCPALGWIAIGNYAIGVMFACGGVAVGGVSLGGVSAGLISIGAVSLGWLALGLLAVGAYAMGGIAVGVIATGAYAFGWVAAEGRYAVAREFALGVHAAARQANDPAARAFFAAHPWLDLRGTAGKALFSLIWSPFVLILAGHCLRARRRKQARRLGTSLTS